MNSDRVPGTYSRPRDEAINRVREQLRQSFTHIIADNMPVETCLTCTEFDEPNEICRLYKARPPARIIALGCPSYFDHDEIPF